MERAQALSSIRVVSARAARRDRRGDRRVPLHHGVRQDPLAARARRHRRAPRRHAAALPPARRDARAARAAAGHLRHRHARRRHQRADPHGAASRRSRSTTGSGCGSSARASSTRSRGAPAAPATTPPAPSSCMAPEHEIENAGRRPQGRRRPEEAQEDRAQEGARRGSSTGARRSFERLVAAEPEPLAPQLQLTAAMLINVIARGGDVVRRTSARSCFDNHEPRPRQYELARRALGIFRTLRDAGVVEIRRRRTPRPPASGSPSTCSRTSRSTSRCRRSRSPRSGCSTPTTAPGTGAGTGHYALDVVSVIEATLDDPRPVLSQQQFLARGEAVAAMKRDGHRVRRSAWSCSRRSPTRSRSTSCSPQSFEVFASSQPWVRDFELSPKSVVRDMFERAHVVRRVRSSFYQLARSEGLVLRYLSDAYRAIRQTVPTEAQTRSCSTSSRGSASSCARSTRASSTSGRSSIDPVADLRRRGPSCRPRRRRCSRTAARSWCSCATSCSAACSSPRSQKRRRARRARSRRRTGPARSTPTTTSTTRC